jgi:hypothetical protein
MRVLRLNDDATWALTLAGTTLVFDPWLVGSEVDFGAWFNQAWHTGPVVPPEAVPPHDAVVLSQPYADHFHPETLAALPTRPVWRVPGGGMARGLAALGRASTAIPAWGSPPAEIGALRLWRLDRPWSRPPKYYAVVVAGPDDRAVLHAPHGLGVDQLPAGLDVVLVATTRVRFELPGLHINPGHDAAEALLEAADARGLAIHDEDKRAVGLVNRLSTVTPAPPPGSRWIRTEVGTEVALG